MSPMGKCVCNGNELTNELTHSLTLLELELNQLSNNNNSFFLPFFFVFLPDPTIAVIPIWWSVFCYMSEKK
jgi:hypothetical protein